MNLIDKILDKYFGNKLAILITKHYEMITGLKVKWLYDSGLKEYVVYVEDKETYTFPLNKGFILLTQLVTQGWTEIDSRLKEVLK